MIKHYTATVHDPQTGQTTNFARFGALNDGNAEQTAKDGFTGLLGPDVKEVQDRLKVYLRDA